MKTKRRIPFSAAWKPGPALAKVTGCFLVIGLLLSNESGARGAETASKHDPLPVIFDTDVGNDVDDVLALALLHALQARGECKLLAVTITKPDELAGPFVDAVNTFYGRPEIPIGFTHASLTNETSKFLKLADTTDNGHLRYPHRLKKSSDAPEATRLLRRILAQQSDASVVLIQVGYFSNFAALLDTAPDEYSKLGGADLVRRKVRFLSVMAGAFKMKERFREYNVVQDLAASKKLAASWPTPIVWSGFEIGIAVPFPAVSIQRDFSYVPHHPVAAAYCLYDPPPHERPTWDLTSALYGVLTERNYFGISEPGQVVVETDGFTSFTPKPDGRDRYLMLDEKQIIRLKEALVQLASQPPAGLK
jgi:hypothetical protein